MQGWQEFGPNTQQRRREFQTALERIGDPQKGAATHCTLKMKWPAMPAGDTLGLDQRETTVPGCPKKLRKMLSAGRRGAGSTTPDTAWNESMMQDNMPYDMLASPLKYNWRQLVYTDGSQQEQAASQKRGRAGPGEEQYQEPGSRTRQIIGSGIFIPDTNQVADEIEGTQVCVDPMGQGVTNTNNRAELVAIAAALQRGHTTIATDSLVCLRWIRKAVLRPWLLTNHVHAPLLQYVVQLVHQATTLVTLHKVKAHNGIVGNVMADKCADHAVNSIRYGTGAEESFELFNDPFADKTWLRVQDPLPAGTRITKPSGWELRDMKREL